MPPQFIRVWVKEEPARSESYLLHGYRLAGAVGTKYLEVYRPDSIVHGQEGVDLAGADIREIYQPSMDPNGDAIERCGQLVSDDVRGRPRACDRDQVEAVDRDPRTGTDVRNVWVDERAGRASRLRNCHGDAGDCQGAAARRPRIWRDHVGNGSVGHACDGDPGCVRSRAPGAAGEIGGNSDTSVSSRGWHSNLRWAERRGASQSG